LLFDPALYNPFIRTHQTRFVRLGVGHQRGDRDTLIASIWRCAANRSSPGFSGGPGTLE